jgi:adenine-specific DNA-methyltransferase
METHGVKYIGSKRTLLSHIVESVADLPVGRMLDVFAGTTRVAQAFRKRGWHTCAGDLSWASESYAALFLTTTPEELPTLTALVAELNTLEGVEDWITRSYCDVLGAEGGIVRVWKPKNGKKADAIRNKIAEWETNGRVDRSTALRLIAVLILALDAVDSTVGVQQAYLKDWAKRADNDLRLVVPEGIAQGPVGEFRAGSCLEGPYSAADVAYLDPPYSPHSYATYYHIWDSITRWDKPEVCLKTNRRKDRTAEHFDRTMKSPWNSKREALSAFETLLNRLPVHTILLSYSNESLLSLEDLRPVLETFHSYDVQEIDYKRNIMSRIGNATLYDKNRQADNIEYLIRISVRPTPAT